MDLSTNSLPIMTLLLSCAALTMASCVVSIGVGNRFERTIEQFQEFTCAFDLSIDADPAALQKGMRQVKESELRAYLMTRALNCFYASIAGFGLGSLTSLLTAVLLCTRLERAVFIFFVAAIVIDAFGTVAMIGGAAMLFREVQITFRDFQERCGFFTQRARQIVLRNSELSPGR